MTERTNSPDSLGEFLSRIHSLLSPVYAECFSDETRRIRNLLLIVSFVIFLSTLGLVSVTQQSAPLSFVNVTVTRGMHWVLLAVCGYLLVIHSARSYNEWSLWRLSHQAQMVELRDLYLQLSSQSYGITEAAFACMKLSEKLSELTKEPPELLDANRRLTAHYEEYHRAGMQLRLKQNHLQPHEFESETLKLRRMFEDLMRLQDEVDRERNEHERRIAPEREALKQQLHVAEQTHRVETSALGGLRVPKAKQEYIEEAMRPMKWITETRLSLEILFPTAFAIGAMLASLIVPGRT